jgi:hypothetical protein
MTPGDFEDLKVQGVTDCGRCPIDGAPLRAWTVQVNGPASYTHTDGTTHGDLSELVPLLEAQMLLAVASVTHAAQHKPEIEARESLARAREARS